MTFDDEKFKYGPVYNRAYYNANREKILQQKKAYRKANSEKVREWKRKSAAKRRGLKTEFIYKLMVQQKGRCAICAVEVTAKHHLDHIVPVAKGGKTEFTNLQLLCPTCNLQKSSADFIDHMQRKGKLL